MANFNVAIPTTAAVPFHPSSESLQRDNAIRPTIPKPEIVSKYEKFREDEYQKELSKDHLNHQNQHEKRKEQEEQKENNQQSLGQMRSLFFAKHTEIMEEESVTLPLIVVRDFKITMSVIEFCYKSRVTPIARATVECLI
jgi:ATP-dependent 26S proteasome regulatory subunit